MYNQVEVDFTVEINKKKKEALLFEILFSNKQCLKIF